MNTSRLIEFFHKLVRCPECNDNVIITREIKLKYGLAHFFKAKCCSEICDWSDTLLTSNSVDSNLGGRKLYEINLRACMASREIGGGYKSIQEFCKLMNIPPPMDSKSYRKSFTKLYRAYTAATYDSVTNAAK